MAAGLDRLIKASDADHRSHFREWLLGAVQDKRSFAEGPLETYLDLISGPVGQASLFQHQVRHYDPRHTNELAERLHELGRLPVQLIWGADDAWQVLDWAHRLHHAIPGSKLSILDDCGHFSPEDRPEAVADVLIDFLRANSKSSPD